jgi:class 3 adenylate cyclase/tetratricopeptide (TPR) repeat protein
VSLRRARSKTPSGAGEGFTRSPERRQLTVMFCDLVGSTALFAQLDPEEISQILRLYLRCCAERIEAAGGFVAQFQGDGVLGYFGYTQASENNAEQAVRAALEIIEMAPKFEVPRSGQLRVRIGISSGLAVVGDPSGEGTRLEQGAVGETLHLAARLQAVASPNEIVIANSTRRLTGSLFRYRDLGKLTLKGFVEPVQVWRVLGPRPNLSQFKARRNPLLTEIVGRDAEIETLLQLWRRAVAGQGQSVGIVGEAGIGKSRLISEFRHRIRRERHIWLEGGGAPSFMNTPFYAIAQAIKLALDPVQRALPLEFRSRLERALEGAGLRASEISPLIVEMLDLPGAESFSTLSVAPTEWRNRLFSAVMDWVHGTAQHRPLAIAIEDLHWLDPSSLELVGYLVERIRTLPVLMLHSMRPGFRPASLVPDYSTHLYLSRVANDDLRRIITKVQPTAVSLTDEDVEHVLRRAEGVPLFGIELARFVGEQHARTTYPEIPATLSDLLAARLDQLGPAKSVAQIAAAIGSEIPLRVLEAVADISLPRLRARLKTLRQSGVLQEENRYPNVIYKFTHALLRDAAYDALLKSRRRELHRRIATAIAERFSTFAASRPEFLAYHWTNAGEFELGSAAWEQAGDFAASRRAFTEAERAYQNAITGLMNVPPSHERDPKELRLRSSLADALRITHGFSAQETIEATVQARALADRNGDRAQQFLQMWGAWTAASSSGNHAAAITLANEFYRLALADGNPDRLAHGHMIQMTSRYRVGDLIGAEDHFRRGEAFFAAPEFWQRPGLIAQTYGNAALIAWILDDEAEAQQRVNHALAVARAKDNPYDLAYAECMTAIHLVLLNRFEAAAEFARSSIVLSDKHTFPQFAAISRVALGRAQARLGFAAEGTTLMREGLARMAGTSVRVAITRYMTWLAEELLRASSFNEALVAAEDALQINPQELFFRPETLRLRGEILIHTGRLDEAERDFLEAISLANRMGAKRFRDRATASLQQLLRRVAA